MRIRFDEERFQEHNTVETPFSVIKGRFGEEVKVRKYW
jgi:hypothetical protein